MNKKVILPIDLMVISVSLLCGCSDSENKGGTIIQSKPDIKVTSYTDRTGYEGINYCLYIDIVVKNYGADGSAYVWAEVNQDSNHYEKRQGIYLKSGNSESLTLKFCEVSFWSVDKGSYRVWVE